MEVSSLNTSINLTSPQAPLYLAEYQRTLMTLWPLWPAIVLFGFTSNIINIITFLKAGINDNMGVLLVSLAVSDLTFLTLMTPSVYGFFFVTFLNAHPWLIILLLYWPAFTAYDLSAFISVSLGVMRCACVAMPLTFKVVFTKQRTIKWVFFLVVLAVSLRMPILTVNRIGWRTDPVSNKSMPYLVQINSESMAQVMDILNRGIMVYLAYITMLVCVCVLSSKLYQAAEIRRSCTARIDQTQPSDNTQNKTAAQGLSLKDMQVVKSVVLVCIIFLFSQFPFVLTSTIRLINPEINSGRRMGFLFGIFGHVHVTCAFLNASINIFVYYNYNSKYRATFQSLFCGKMKN